jgi:hypothetical protein
VPVESRNARAIASGISFCAQESSGVLKTATRGPANTPVIVGVPEAARPSIARSLCADETAIRAKLQRIGKIRFIVLVRLSYLTPVSTDPLEPEINSPGNTVAEASKLR